MVAGLTGLAGGVLLGVVSGVAACGSPAVRWATARSPRSAHPPLATGDRGGRPERDRRSVRGHRRPLAGAGLRPATASAAPGVPRLGFRGRAGSAADLAGPGRGPALRDRVAVRRAAGRGRRPGLSGGRGRRRRRPGRRRAWSTPAAAGCPTFVCALGDHPDRGRLGPRAGSRARRGSSPDLVVSAGFMKIVGPAVLDAFGGRLINTHPALLPAFPGAHAVPRRPGRRGDDDRVRPCTSSTPAWTPVRCWRSARSPVLPGDDEASLHERIKDVERELLVQTVARARHRRTRRGRAPDERPHPHPPRAAGRLRQDRRRGAGRRAGRGRRRAGEHRRHRAPDRRRPASRSRRSSRSPASRSAWTAG